MEWYRGPSMIDGQRIVAITTGDSNNPKTGDQLQMWILSANMDPLAAIYNNVDRSVCGDCKHRGSTCYVAVYRAPLNIYRSWLKGKYARCDNFSHFTGASVRFGSYGDPCALPLSLIKRIAAKAKSYTGYTHQWRMPHAISYKDYLMASVDTLAEHEEAKALGWRTFRVKVANTSKLPNEIVCPASNEAGKKTTCAKCGLCSGIKGKGKKDVVINVHGLPYKVARFELQMAS